MHTSDIICGIRNYYFWHYFWYIYFPPSLYTRCDESENAISKLEGILGPIEPPEAAAAAAAENEEEGEGNRQQHEVEKEKEEEDSNEKKEEEDEEVETAKGNRYSSMYGR